MPKDAVSTSADGPSCVKCQNNIIFQLIDFGARLSRQCDKASKVMGLTIQQWMVLLHIKGELCSVRCQDGTPRKAKGQPVLSSEIADARGVSRAMISATISELIKKDLVQQVDDGGDRRKKVLSNTQKAEEYLANLSDHKQSLRSRLLEGFTDQEIQALEALLIKLNVNLSKMG